MKAVQKENQEIHLDYKGDETFITDKRLLKNIVINLLSNALKFSDKNSNVWLNVENRVNELSVEIKDEGVGISPEDQQHLFTTFFRGKNVINIQGTGMGLTIVKRYLDLLDGTISLQSQLNKGTTVIIVLHRLKDSEPQI
jgi:signal transduction histidine kinase